MNGSSRAVRSRASAAAAHTLFEQAWCPVLVVDATDPQGEQLGPVFAVVGSDPGDEEVLAVAFAEARRRGCDLIISQIVSTPDSKVCPSAAESLRHEEERLLGDMLRPLRDKYPDVWVQASGRATRDDVAAGSADASLLVVGSRHAANT